LVGILTYHKQALFSINDFLFILFPFFPGGPGGPCGALSVSFKGKHLENVIKSSKSSQILPLPPKPPSLPRHRKEKEICSTFEIDFYLLEVTNFKLTFQCLTKQQPKKTADILRR